MHNERIARAFEDIAEFLELKGENPFRIRAYRRASENIAAMAQDLGRLGPDELKTIPGIGKDLAAKISEFLETGHMAALERLKDEIPEGVLEIMAIPGVGPKTAGRFFRELDIDSVEALEARARSGGLTGLAGIGEKKIAAILRGIDLLRRGRERQPLGRILPLAEALLEAIAATPGIITVSLAGSLRRWRETIKDIDILAAAERPDPVMEALAAHPDVEQVLLKGPTKTSVLLTQGIQVDLRIVDRDSFGAALQYFTGSKRHNIRVRELGVRKGLKINEYGVYRERDGKRMGGDREEDIYTSVGLPFIPPELREDGGEIEAALAGQLPDIVEQGDIRGDLHVHSDWSDGAHSVAELAQAARERGYRYIAITDHSQGLGVAGGLDAERLTQQAREIAAVNRKLKGFRVFHGIELDIRADGSLDLPDDVLRRLDFIIASVHSGFNQAREKITARITKAMRSPLVRAIAHPTGRLIGKREAYDVDMEAVIRVAAETGTALEINSYPLRLDLNDSHAREAARHGAPIVIGTDAHVVSQFDAIRFGIGVARRAWLEKNSVVNTLSLADFQKWIKRGKPEGRK